MTTRKVHITRTRCGKCDHLERGNRPREWQCKTQGNYWYAYDVVSPEFASFCEKFKPLTGPRQP